MRFLLDGTNFPGSDANTSLPKYGGDVFGKGIDPKVPVDDDYQPGANIQDSYSGSPSIDEDPGYESMNAGQEIDPEIGDYSSMNDGNTIDPTYDGYESQNAHDFNNEEFKSSAKAKDKARLIDEAKRIMNRGQATAQRTVPKKIGAALGDKHMFKGNSPEDRERAKKLATEKIGNYAKDKLGKKIGNKAFSEGLERGGGKGGMKLAKEAGKIAKQAKNAATAAKTAKNAATAAKTGVTAAKTAITGLGAATGIETLGVGFIVSILLNIAISLGVSDAIDAVFKLKEGDLKEARFLVMRAAAKVGMFIVFLVSVVMIFSIAGVFFAIPILLALNIYAILGLVFKKVGALQGFVWWELIILVWIDFIAFIILAAFIGGVVYYLCSSSGLGSGGVTGAVTGAAVSVYDWWNGTDAGSFAQDICTQVNATPL